MTEDVPPGSTPDTLPRGLFLRVTSPWEHDPQIQPASPSTRQSRSPAAYATPGKIREGIRQLDAAIKQQIRDLQWVLVG